MSDKPTEEIVEDNEPRKGGVLFSDWLIPMLLVVLAGAYRLGGDAVAGLTLFPFWAWGIVLLLGTSRFRLRRLKWAFSLGFVFWLGCSIFTGEEAMGFTRSRVRDPNIAVLNCAGGSKEAAREAFKTGTHLILLTESPGEMSVSELVDEEWSGGGEFISGPDGAIAVKGSIVDGTTKELINATMATVEFDGVRLNVVALRLQPPLFRVDVWSPSYWGEMKLNLESRREELRDLVEEIKVHFGEKGADIIAGDFNAPIPQGVGTELGGYMEAVSATGGGWLGSAVNDYPFVRIDHVYIGPRMLAKGARVQKTKNSDHRMVMVKVLPKN